MRDLTNARRHQDGIGRRIEAPTKLARSGTRTTTPARPPPREFKEIWPRTTRCPIPKRKAYDQFGAAGAWPRAAASAVRLQRLRGPTRRRLSTSSPTCSAASRRRPAGAARRCPEGTDLERPDAVVRRRAGGVQLTIPISRTSRAPIARHPRGARHEPDHVPRVQGARRPVAQPGLLLAVGAVPALRRHRPDRRARLPDLLGPRPRRPHEALHRPDPGRRQGRRPHPAARPRRRGSRGRTARRPVRARQRLALIAVRASGRRLPGRPSRSPRPRLVPDRVPAPRRGGSRQTARWHRGGPQRSAQGTRRLASAVPAAARRSKCRVRRRVRRPVH